MNVGTQLKDSIKKWTKRLAAPLLALALITSFATYEFAKPTAAKAADAAPSAAPLDADSVGALLALDKAMETLAARVTPAVVNGSGSVCSSATACSFSAAMWGRTQGLQPLGL